MSKSPSGLWAGRVMSGLAVLFLLFDSVGNAGPSIWVEGRIVGGWAQRPDGRIALQLLEDVGSDARQAIDASAGRLEAWLGPERFRTVFAGPLEIDLRDA